MPQRGANFAPHGVSEYSLVLRLVILYLQTAAYIHVCTVHAYRALEG